MMIDKETANKDDIFLGSFDAMASNANQLTFANREEIQKLLVKYGDLDRFLQFIAARFWQRDSSAKFVATLENEPESSDKTLALLLESTTLEFAQAEELLDDAVADAYVQFKNPPMQFVAALR